MARLSWSPNAQRDLVQIQTFIARDSTAAARRLIQSIRESVRILRDFPESGAVVTELGAPFRHLVVGRYRVIYIYRPERNLARILGVVHGSRLLPTFDEDD